MTNVSRSHFDTEMGKVLKALKDMSDTAKATNTKVDKVSETQEAMGAQVQEVLGPIQDLSNRVVVAEKKVSAQGRHVMRLRERQVRIQCTKAAAGANEDEVVSFLETEFAKIGYSRDVNPNFTVTAPVLFGPFTAKQAGAPGSYREAVSGVECWTIVVTLYSRGWAFKIRTSKELRGADKLVSVGQELDPFEIEEKATIQASPSFKAAAQRYRDSYNRWPMWDFATAKMGREVWTLDRVLKEDAAAAGASGSGATA